MCSHDRSVSVLSLICDEGQYSVIVAAPPHPQEVLGSRWEVMELCGSVGSDMTSCQALMQANIWRLLATSLHACWQGPLARGQKPPWGTLTQGQTWASETVSSSNNGVRTAGVTLPSVVKWKQRTSSLCQGNIDWDSVYSVRVDTCQSGLLMCVHGMELKH